MVVQGLQHDIHGESKQASKEDVENQIEEKDESCREKREFISCMPSKWKLNMHIIL